MRLIGQDPPLDAVEEAGEILGGYPIEFVDHRNGSILLEIVEVESQPVGMYYGGRPCRAITRSIGDPIVIAHELGHALGLEHVDPEDHPTNLMSPMAADIDLMDWQQDDIDRGVRRLGRCPSY